MARMFLAIGLLGTLLTTNLQADEPRGELSLKDCPADVRQTLKRELPDEGIDTVEAVKGTHPVIYRVVLKQDGKWYETKVRRDGVLISKLLDKKTRTEQGLTKKEVYWVEITHDDLPYDVAISPPGTLLSKQLRESEDPSAKEEPKLPGPVVLPRRIPKSIRGVVTAETKHGEMTSPPILAKDNPRVPKTTFKFSWSWNTGEGTKLDIDLEKTPAVD